MSKILKKYTTIPPHLYVKRKADNQLSCIITDMQRPGYVLVARQMGKTNLLFNAMRSMKNEKRFFGYVDMSNLFKKERECYQNIIDLIVEPNEDYLSENLLEEIYLLREKKLPPHKEYTKSLRLILEHFDGDIVIVLDEIDALKTVEYSDNIFAQIRSNYFSRTNFPEFERLTYVLSGVIEPIELIKDRNKSPFNIGDKIYLDDFTETEFNCFIEYSKLEIDENIKNDIYNWTKGNPRLTFDICSDVETFISDSKSITSELLEQLVHKKYLTSYDHAPIDHIRELVKGNKSIRNALIDLRDHPLITLNDEIKQKLYLYGIITSDFTGPTKFKNPIVDKALSIDWLRNLNFDEDEEIYDVSYGIAFVNSNQFEKAIEVLERYISNAKGKPIAEQALYYLGFSYYQLGHIEKALKQFSSTFENAPYKSRAICLKGICEIKLGNEQGFLELEKVEDDEDDFAAHNALFNLSRNGKNSRDRSLELLDKLEHSLAVKPNRELQVASSYARHEFFQEIGDLEESKKALMNALDKATPAEAFAIKLKLCEIEPTKANKESLVSHMYEKQLPFIKSSEIDLHFDEDNFIKALKTVYDINDKSLFNKMLCYADSHLRIDEQKKYEIIFAAGIHVHGIDIAILKELSNYESTLNLELSLKLYRHLCTAFDMDFKSYFEKFDKYSKDLGQISEVDLVAYSTCLRKLYELREFTKILKVCLELEHRLSQQINDESITLTSATIFFWKGVVYANLDNSKLAIEALTLCSQIIRNSNYKKTAYLSKEHFESISDHERQLKSRVFDLTSVVHKKTFSNPTNLPKFTNKQNVVVRYLNGIEKSGKYKRFAKDIEESKCEVVDY